MGMKPKVVRKKKAPKKKMKKRVGRPRVDKTYVELGLRATIEERSLIDRAIEAETKRIGFSGSRNSYCLRAAVAAAKKELSLAEGGSAGDNGNG